jgi:hypothetical protein
MPGPHLELKIMQTWADVGGCDAWMGRYWRPNQQWWVGWHSLQNLPNWAWPSDDWVLIGYERWYQPRRGDPKLLEAFYASPKGNFFTKGRGTGKTGKGKSKAK